MTIRQEWSPRERRKWEAFWEEDCFDIFWAMRRWQRQAERRNIYWSLTREEFCALWRQPCVYCGAVIATVGIDRYDNQDGYTRENVMPCCGPCNLEKKNLRIETWWTRKGEVAYRAWRERDEIFSRHLRNAAP